MKRTLAVALAAGTVLVSMGVTAPAASARSAVVSKSVAFPAKTFTVNGQVRARLRNGVVTWHKNTADGFRWVTIKAQIIDTGPGDGHCARLSTDVLGDADPTAKECNGVWTTRTLRTHEQPSVYLYLYTNPNLQGSSLRTIGWSVTKPAGF
ncbi:hypothetical protein [Streptosporangium oxazolinicum]|uniref:hypothetical protein n=1 Tax=Streptosporangium oxazolinicum TaxID=909287 RepID=UPI0031E5DF29